MKPKLTLHGKGDFHINNVDKLSYTYFPLCNTLSMKSSISPALSGSATIDHNSQLLPPTSIVDLDNSLFKRNVFFKVNDSFIWSITGQTPKQILTPDKTDLYGDFLVHTIKRTNDLFTCTIESFVPNNDTYQELHKVTMKNTTDNPLTLKSVVGVPIYGRSADTLRDHRHVTSLLNRVKVVNHGIINHPTFSFDERGHIINDKHYGVFAKSSHHASVKHYYPTLESFTGEGHTLLDPEVVRSDCHSPYKVGDVVNGYEAIAGLEYEGVTLKKNESLTLVLSLGVGDSEDTLLAMEKALSVESFEQEKEATLKYWKEALSPLEFNFPNQPFNGWLKWVTLQPTLRRLYGNSFMPYHDYGRGGRGWRDLWQDLLALILMEPSSVRALLMNNFKGVRIDGSNATIIGEKPGEFIADRNNIPRIWMDHGSWPLLTTKLYLDQSGDTEILFEKLSYFQDQFTHYTKQTNPSLINKDNTLKTFEGKEYEGTLLEHLFIQNLVPFYNVGKHNNIRLEDADWNDGLDMAPGNGESVAFTSFYGQNLITLADLIRELGQSGMESVQFFKEIEPLLNSVNHHDVALKNAVLNSYFNEVKNGVSGELKSYSTDTLETILREKGQALLEQVRDNEWLEHNGEGWFNGYYDDDSVALDNVEKNHMTLTGQVFSIMSDAATDQQVEKVINCADKYLYDKAVGGYRLNTDFNEVKTNMGRLFGFAYGHKENGAMFSHMALMYANALYKRGFVEAGYKVLNTIYTQSMQLDTAKMYPGIPEYFDPSGRGMYPYLTGSASWYILTMVTEVFGVKGDLGLPVFEPKLLKHQFEDSTTLTIKTVVGSKLVEVNYENPLKLSFKDYEIETVLVNDEPIDFIRTQYGVKLTQKLTQSSITIRFKKKK